MIPDAHAWRRLQQSRPTRDGLLVTGADLLARPPGRSPGRDTGRAGTPASRPAARQPAAARPLPHGHRLPGYTTGQLWVVPGAVLSAVADLVLYSSSISLSAACSGKRHAAVSSGGLRAASRSMAMR